MTRENLICTLDLAESSLLAGILTPARDETIRRIREARALLQESKPLFLDPTRPGDRALIHIAEEHYGARQKFRPFASGHEGWAVIREELDELWDEVKLIQPAWVTTDYSKARKEAVQVAAMALAFIMEVCEGRGAPIAARERRPERGRYWVWFDNEWHIGQYDGEDWTIDNGTNFSYRDLPLGPRLPDAPTEPPK